MFVDFKKFEASYVVEVKFVNQDDKLRFELASHDSAMDCVTGFAGNASVESVSYEQFFKRLSQGV